MTFSNEDAVASREYTQHHILYTRIRFRIFCDDGRNGVKPKRQSITLSVES